MRQGRRTVLTVVPLLLVALFLVGCPKRPATTVASAPAPAAATVPGLAVVPAPAPAPATPGVVVVPPAATAPAAPSPATPPRPSEFMANPALKDIYFDFDKSDVRPADAKILDDNAGWLKQNANTLVLIEGHCDERGTNEYNLALGERRAKSTMNYLVSQGIQANRITIISYGEERPVCTEKNEACWAKNRHAHFLVKTR